MSSYEDIYGMASTIFEALKNMQWRSPNLESLIDPVSEQLLLSISHSQTLVASPTLAAPTNIRAFLSNIFSSVQDTNQLVVFIGFLIAVPIFSTFIVAMFTNVNIVLRALHLPSARNPISTSPLAVILLMVTIFGNIPLVAFFPTRAAQVQAYLPIQPGHYHGPIATVLRIVAFYEKVELGVCVALEAAQLIRHRRVEFVRLLQPASVIDWVLSIAGFALRMWFTRVSTDTATSPIQSGSTIWVWRKVILRTDARYQTSDEYNDDVFVWMAYFFAVYCLSSAVVKYALLSKQREYQSVETKIIKVTPSSTIHTVSVGCQTTVSGEDWVPKSDIAADIVRVGEIEAVIESDIKTITAESVKCVRAAQIVAEKVKQDTLRWQNDHTALNTQISALKEFRTTLERHEEDGLKQRELADKLSGAIKRLETLVKQRGKTYEEKLQAREKIQQARVDGLIEQFVALEKEAEEQAGIDGKKKASESDANLGPREAESHSVSANTPELQATPQTSVTVVIKTDAKSSSDPMLPSPPLSPPNAEGSDSQESVEVDRKSGINNSDAIAQQSSSPTRADSNSIEATSSASVESCVEPEKTSDSEMDAANVSIGSDSEIIEEIGNDIWSRVQKLKFRSADICTIHSSIQKQHFTVQEIQNITAMLTTFKNTVANDIQRQQISTLLSAGFPYLPTFKYLRHLNFLLIFLDIAEANKQLARERVYTDLPVSAYAYACGVPPARIALPNFRRAWRMFFETQPARMDERLELTAVDDKPNVKADMDAFMNTVSRLLGQREELWKKDMTPEQCKPNHSWDMNLIARRLLENLGLLKFREDTTEGTSLEPYIPPPSSEPVPIENAISEASPAEEMHVEKHSPKTSCSNLPTNEPLSIIVPDAPVETHSHSTTEDSPNPPCEASPVYSDPPAIIPIGTSHDTPSTPSSAQPSPTSPLPKATPTKVVPSKSTAPDWGQEVREDMALQQQAQRTGAPNPHRNHTSKPRRSHGGGKNRRGGGGA